MVDSRKFLSVIQISIGREVTGIFVYEGDDNVISEVSCWYKACPIGYGLPENSSLFKTEKPKEVRIIDFG